VGAAGAGSAALVIWCGRRVGSNPGLRLARAAFLLGEEFRNIPAQTFDLGVKMSNSPSASSTVEVFDSAQDDSVSHDSHYRVRLIDPPFAACYQRGKVELIYDKQKSGDTASK
jgi:hypothetical protein